MALSEFPNFADPWYLRASIVMQGASGLPRDETVNTLSFVAEKTMGFAAVLQIHNDIQELWTAIGGSFSNEIARTGAQVHYYDWSIAPPNPPLYVEALSIPARLAGVVDMPRELAMCVSFKAPTLSGTVPARRRGRIYLGPLVQDSTSLDYDMPQAATLTAFAGAFGAFLQASQANEGSRWAIVSRRIAGGWLSGQQGPPNLAGAVSPVDEGWIDNAWDIQRRRGLEPTSRVTF